MNMRDAWSVQGLLLIVVGFLFMSRGMFATPHYIFILDAAIFVLFFVVGIHLLLDPDGTVDRFYDDRWQG